MKERTSKRWEELFSAAVDLLQDCERQWDSTNVSARESIQIKSDQSISYELFEGLVYSGGLVVLANFECRFAVTVVFIWRFTDKELLRGCGKS